LSFGVDLCVYDPKYKGGVGRYSLSIAKALINQSKFFGLDCKIICSRYNQEFLKNVLEIDSDRLIVHKLYGTKVYQVLHSFSYRLNSQKVFNFVRFLTNLSFGSLIRQLSVMYTPTTYLNFNGSMPCLVSLHDTQETAIPENFSQKQIIYRKLNRNYTLEKSFAIQVSSEFIKKEITKNGLSSRSNFDAIVIPEGVDLRLFEPVRKKDTQLSGLIILVVANFHKHKGHNFLIKALAGLNLEKEVKVVFVGEGDTLEKNRSLAGLCQSKYLNFKFTGKISDDILLQWYREAHLVISASDYESSSLPILEGLAMGCVILASDIPAHEEMKKVLPIELYEKNSMVSFHAKMHEIIKDADRVFSLQEIINRNKSSQAFSWERIADQYLEFIKKVAIK
jgi:glycosyltransferase involved in cell wall biosynthesis